MPNQPFIGVCGIQTAAEFAHLQQLAPDILAGTDRFLMAGIKTVTDEAMADNTSATVQPFVHCDFSAQEPFEQIVKQRLRTSRRFVKGLQLNVLPWMEIDYSRLWIHLKQQHPGVLLMLQAHQAAMDGYSPQQIASRLRGLAIDYILFDASQSRGIPYDPGDMSAYVKAVREVQPDIGIVVAGGLSGPRMEALFAPLLQTDPLLSCDAFGQLQDSSGHKLSLPLVGSYLSSWKNAITTSKAIYTDPVSSQLILAR